MILRSSPASPFGRKVKIAASILGLLPLIHIEVANTTDPQDRLRVQNPLGKIPVLILTDGRCVYDSRVIIEYLCSLVPDQTLVPLSGIERFDVLGLQALADGIMDAALLQRYERVMRPLELQSQTWYDYQGEKITRGLSFLNAKCPDLSQGTNLGHVALACALSYLDFRFDGAWRSSYPQLVIWLDDFRIRHLDIFDKTKPA